MLRIAHFSDFHMSSNCDELKNFIIPALLNDLEDYNKIQQIDLIIFSGDLVHKGGESFENDLELAFLSFHDVVIEPMISKINLTTNRVFIVPGNHDINRNEDSAVIENGLKGSLLCTEDINKFINKNTEEGIRRVVPFKMFEKDFYSGFDGEKKLTNFQSVFKFALDGISIGIACFNSAWRSYDTQTDNGQLILGEQQLINARNIIQGCDVKIAIMHHSINSLVLFDQRAVEPIIIRDYDLVFCGHVHEGDTWAKSNMHGKMFVSVAPSNWPDNLRSSDRSYAIGYYLLDYDRSTKQITTHARRYSHPQERFASNSDLGDDAGKTTYCLLDAMALTKYTKEMEVSSLIKMQHYDELNEHLLSLGVTQLVFNRQISWRT